MDKDWGWLKPNSRYTHVSTLVLMDSWIKTSGGGVIQGFRYGFNPCFNGFMDKDACMAQPPVLLPWGFNPCFNGFMDKDDGTLKSAWHGIHVSTLVLMDSWIKTNLLNDIRHQ